MTGLFYVLNDCASIKFLLQDHREAHTSAFGLLLNLFDL